MPKSRYTDRYNLLVILLKQERKRAKFTQTELAKRLGRPQSYVAKYENGERRLDVIEFIEVAGALGADPAKIVKMLTSANR